MNGKDFDLLDMSLGVTANCNNGCLAVSAAAMPPDLLRMASATRASLAALAAADLPRLMRCCLSFPVDLLVASCLASLATALGKTTVAWLSIARTPTKHFAIGAMRSTSVTSCMPTIMHVQHTLSRALLFLISTKSALRRRHSYAMDLCARYHFRREMAVCRLSVVAESARHIIGYILHCNLSAPR